MADPHWNRTSPNISSMPPSLNVGIFCSQPCNRIFWNKRVTQPHLKFHIHKYIYSTIWYKIDRNPSANYLKDLALPQNIYLLGISDEYMTLGVIRGIICQGDIRRRAGNAEINAERNMKVIKCSPLSPELLRIFSPYNAFIHLIYLCIFFLLSEIQR